MSILILTEGGNSGIGGSEIFVKELLYRINKERFKITLGCIDLGNIAGLLEQFTRDAGCDFILIKYRKKFKIDLKAIFHLRKEVKKHQINLIHATSGYTAIMGVLAGILTGIPIVYTVQMPIAFSFKTKLFLSIIGQRINVAVAVSRAVAETFKQIGLVRPLGMHQRVIYCGVDMKEYKLVKDANNAKRKIGLPGNRIIGGVGHLIPNKGYIYLIKAMPKVMQLFPDTQLIIVGKGEEEYILKQTAQDLNVKDNVKFLGRRRDVFDIISSFDVFVHPSLTEGLGVAILEACAAGKPVIGSNVGGIPEIIKNGQNGFLVESKNSNVLAERIIELLSDPYLRSKMGRVGRKLVEEKFEIGEKIREYEKIYCDLLKKRSQM